MSCDQQRSFLTAAPARTTLDRIPVCGSEALVLCAMAAAVGVQQARSVE